MRWHDLTVTSDSSVGWDSAISITDRYGVKSFGGLFDYTAVVGFDVTQHGGYGSADFEGMETAYKNMAELWNTETPQQRFEPRSPMVPFQSEKIDVLRNLPNIAGSFVRKQTVVAPLVVPEFKRDTSTWKGGSGGVIFGFSRFNEGLWRYLPFGQ